MKKIFLQHRGFTLVEIMVSMVIVSLVVAGIYGVYTIQQRTYTVQEQVTEMQQKIRAALDFMTRDMRMINFKGLDGECSDIEGIVDATPTNFSFFYCERGNEINATYNFDGTRLTRSLGGPGIPIAEGVDAFEFCYLEEIGDGDEVQCMDNPNNNIDAIRAVRISMLVRSTFPDPRHTDTIVYRPASVPPDNIPEVNWLDPNPPNDNFHRRLLITTVQLRNMGL